MKIVHHKCFQNFDICKDTEIGYKINFLGAKTKKEYDYTYQMEWSEGKYPPFNEEYFEWIDLIEAVLSSSQRFTIMELGAGYGRWSVNAASAATILGKDYRIIAVEAEPQHFNWLQENIIDNGLKKNRCRLVEAAVSKSDGEAKFYSGDQARWYGQRIVFENDPAIGQEDSNRGVHIVPVKTIALSSLLNGEDLIDLIDMDIQGSELEVVKSAKKEISSQVKKIHLATHNDEIEEELRNFFHELGWTPSYDYGCQGKHMTEYGEITFVDGVQGWINPKKNLMIQR